MKTDWNGLVTRAQKGDRDAFDALVRAFRDMAVAYGYSVLKDFHAAEDAAQEAFIQAFLDLPRLRVPAAFPAWLRRIVFKYCDRATRRGRLPTRPFDPETDAPGHGVSQAEERRQEAADEVLHAVGDLPEKERTATVLFYIDGYSMEEVGEFLDVPVSTVKSRLYTARRRLRGARSHVVEATMKNHAPGESFNARVSRVLDGIVRIGFYDGRGNPEDNMLPSVMRTLLEYLGDDCGLPGMGAEPKTRWQWSACALMHGVSGMAFRFAWADYGMEVRTLGPRLLSMYRHVLEAAGCSHEMVLKPDFASGLDVHGLVSTDEDEFRRRIVESIRDRGMPVIGLRMFGPPEPGVIAGYEGDADVILGWDHFQSMDEARADPRVGTEPSGMFRKRDWFRDIGGIVVLTGRSSRPPAERVYREALVRALRDMGNQGTAERPLGPTAFGAWIDALLDDAFYRKADAATLHGRHRAHHETVGELAERRAYGEEFLLQAAEALPTARRDLEQAACCFITIHDMCWRLWQTVGNWRDYAPFDARFADPAVRRELASLVALLSDLDLRAARHVRAALALLGRTELPEGPGDQAPAQREGVRRIPFFSPRIEDAFGPGTGKVDRRGVTMMAAAAGFPLAEAMDPTLRTRFRWADLPAEDRLQRDRVVTDFVCSIFHGLPAMMTYDGRAVLAVGYHIHSMRLLLADPGNPGAEPAAVECSDGKLSGPVAFLTAH